MKKVAYIIAFIFVSFLATPTVVALIDNTVDISFAFNANEEENSKHQITLEFDIKNHHSNYESIRYLQEQGGEGHHYLENYRSVSLDVISPPPKQA